MQKKNKLYEQTHTFDYSSLNNHLIIQSNKKRCLINIMHIWY
jgi:hypothetical protein